MKKFTCGFVQDVINIGSEDKPYYLPVPKHKCDICHRYDKVENINLCESCSFALKWMVDNITKRLKMKYYDKN